jgi:methylthioribose-1-phosphate isomerase
MNPISDPPCTLAWIGDADTGFLRLLDQTLLPTQIQYRDCRTVEDVWEAIRNLRVRGAPAIGIAAAYGVVLAVANSSLGRMDADIQRACKHLATARPTAVNLFWALARMQEVSQRECRTLPDVALFRRELLAAAQTIEDEDRRMCRAIGQAGAALIASGQGILTHCNAGGLATADYGTALAVLFTAAEQGKRIHVVVDETRPLLQGARLTAWELQQRGIETTLICDSMAAQVMKEGRVQLVIVGADRIAANGDTANKIGTYGVAVLAKMHDIPFYVAAPSSTFDLKLASGDAIPIEQRDPREVTHGFGKQTAPDGVHVYNPAFDVTPAALITGMITEMGLIRPVTKDSIRGTLLGP